MFCNMPQNVFNTFKKMDKSNQPTFSTQDFLNMKLQVIRIS